MYKNNSPKESKNFNFLELQTMAYKNGNFLMVETEKTIEQCLDFCSEFHTIGSDFALLALLKHKKVFTYGYHFYAGFNLTEDRQQFSKRKLSLEELILGAIMLYPRYITPNNNSFTNVFKAIEYQHLMDNQPTKKQSFLKRLFI
ncbi:hypothetical protein GW796_08735 [archaeon]|nr:hypothetical protein [archaeon]NCQ51964.1 hypothetical protein [archaeon]